MAKSPQLEVVIQKMRARAAEINRTVEDSRSSYDTFMSQFRMDEDIVCERVGAGGVPAEWISAPGASGDRVILWLHGGGYVIGSMRTHRATLSRISRASGARVLGLEYRLAPENPFPAPVEDCIATYRWLLGNGADPSRIVIGGDSAGGGLTVSAFVALRYLGEPLPAAGVCMSSWADLEHTGESMTSNAEVDPSLSRARLDGMAKAYLGKRDRRTPLASPIYADLHELPPLLIMAGSIEVLRDDSTRLAERARAAGVDVTLEIWDDMPHNWHSYAAILPEGKQAIDRMGKFIWGHTV